MGRIHTKLKRDGTEVTIVVDPVSPSIDVGSLLSLGNDGKIKLAEGNEDVIGVAMEGFINHPPGTLLLNKMERVND